MRKNKILIIFDTYLFDFNYESKQLQKIKRLYNYLTFNLFFLPKYNRLKKRDDVVVVALDIDAKEMLEKNKISFKTINDYKVEQTDKLVYDDSLFLAKNWYKNIEKTLTYEGVSLGRMVENRCFVYVFMDIVRNIKFIERIIETEKPGAIIATNREDLSGKTAIVLGKLKGIQVRTLQPGIVSIKKHILINHIKPNILKDLSLLFGFPTYAWKRIKCHQEEDGQKNKILFLINTPSVQVNQLMPIIKEIRKNPENKAIVLALWKSAIRGLAKEGIQSRTFGNYINEKIIKKANKERRNLNKKWSELRHDSDFKKSLVYDGVPLFGVIENKLSYLFHFVFGDIIKSIEAVGDIVNRENPSIIVLGNDAVEIERTMVAVANMHNIPALVIQHGVTAGTQGYVPLYARKMAVFGKISKEFLIKKGIDANKLIITGKPEYDRLYKGGKFIRKEDICSRLNLGPKRGIVVIATDPSFTNYMTVGVEQKEIIKLVFNALKNFPEEQLVIKIHPREVVSLYQRFLNESKITNVKIVKDIDLFSLLKVCDLLITKSSTVGLEAMLVDKPVIIINLTEEPDIVPYVKYGAALGIYKAQHIVPAIKNILEDKTTQKKLKAKRKEFLFDYCYKQDGKATERVVSLIENMIKS